MSARRWRRCSTRPSDHWRDWVRGLAIPLEWQRVVIRAAITLKLCQHEETGAIVAALTTSIPEAAEFGPQLGLSLLLDPRRLLHGAGAEPARRARRARRLSLLSAQHRRRRPRAAISSRSTRCRASRSSRRASPRRSPAIAAWARSGSATPPTPRSSTTPTARSSSPTPRPFSTSGCCARPGAEDFAALEKVGERALADARPARRRPVGVPHPDQRPHLFSAVMSWAACDRLANIAEQLGLAGRARPRGASAPTAIRATIEAEAWHGPERALRRDLRRRRARRQPAAARRHALPRARRSALPRHLRGGREGAAARRAYAALRRRGRFRPARDRVQFLHLLADRGAPPGRPDARRRARSTRRCSSG